jgi:hypothetical protein
MARNDYDYPTLQEQTVSYGVSEQEAKKQHKSGLSVLAKILIGAAIGAVIIIGIIMLVMILVIVPQSHEAAVSKEGSANYVTNVLMSTQKDYDFTYDDMCDKFNVDFQGRQPVQAFIDAVNNIGIMYASDGSYDPDTNGPGATRCWTIERDVDTSADGTQYWANVKVITDDGYVIKLDPQLTTSLMNETDIADGSLYLFDSTGGMYSINIFPVYGATQYPVVDGFQIAADGPDGNTVKKSTLTELVTSVTDAKGNVVTDWAK